MLKLAASRAGRGASRTRLEGQSDLRDPGAIRFMEERAPYYRRKPPRKNPATDRKSKSCVFRKLPGRQARRGSPSVARRNGMRAP